MSSYLIVYLGRIGAAAKGKLLTYYLLVTAGLRCAGKAHKLSIKVTRNPGSSVLLIMFPARALLTHRGKKIERPVVAISVE